MLIFHFSVNLTKYNKKIFHLPLARLEVGRGVRFPSGLLGLRDLASYAAPPSRSPFRSFILRLFVQCFPIEHSAALSHLQALS